MRTVNKQIKGHQSIPIIPVSISCWFLPSNFKFDEIIFYREIVDKLNPNAQPYQYNSHCIHIFFQALFRPRQQFPWERKLNNENFHVGFFWVLQYITLLSLLAWNSHFPIKKPQWGLVCHFCGYSSSRWLSSILDTKVVESNQIYILGGGPVGSLTHSIMFSILPCSSYFL